MRIEPGALLGSSVTLHPSSLLSHEIYFVTLQANLLTGDDRDPQVDRVRMRMAGYQLEGNLAPRRWRLRPFVSVGGSLTSYKFKNIKLSKKDGVFKYGLRRVGTVVSAFNSAGIAAFDGGSTFRPALTYGGGLKLRVTRLVAFQAEYRENYAKDPDFFNKESLNLSSQGITSAQDSGSRRHSTYLLSVSFTP
jgi:opacity protein-like surface antigen